MKEFNYGNKSSVSSIMKTYGIYGKIKKHNSAQYQGNKSHTN